MKRLTVGHVVGTIDFDENVRSLKIYGSRTIQERGIRVYIIVDVNEIVFFLYLLKSSKQEIANDFILTGVIRVRAGCNLLEGTVSMRNVGNDIA